MSLLDTVDSDATTRHCSQMSLLDTVESDVTNRHSMIPNVEIYVKQLHSHLAELSWLQFVRFKIPMQYMKQTG
jgi:hypothetical protein